MYTEFHILEPPHDKKKIKLTSLNLYKSFYKIIMNIQMYPEFHILEPTHDKKNLSQKFSSF